MVKKRPLLIFALLFTAFVVECAGLGGTGEHASSYEKACKRLRGKILKVQEEGVSIVRASEPAASPGSSHGGEYRIDFSQRAAYVNNNYNDLVREVERFKSGTPKFGARFGDDVKFVEAIFYLALSMPGSRAIPDFYERAGDMIGRAGGFHLEAETVECFNEIKQFRLFFDPDMWDGAGESLAADLVRENDMDGILTHAMVGVAIMDDMDIRKARELVLKYHVLLREDHLQWLRKAVSRAEALAR